MKKRSPLSLSFKIPAFRPAVSLTVAVSFIFSNFTIPVSASETFKVKRSSWALPSTAGINSDDVGGADVVDIFQGPGIALNILEEYKVPAADDPLATALAMDDMLGGVSQAVADLAVNASFVSGGLPREMMDVADRITASTRGMYADVQTMLFDVEAMKRGTQSHYETFNRKELPANELNSASDENAQKVSAMLVDVTAMRESAAFVRGMMTDMQPVLEEMADQGRQAPQYYDRLTRHVQTVRTRFDDLAKNLERSGWPAANDSILQTRSYLDSVQKYVSGSKTYTNSEAGYLQAAGLYLKNAADYFGRVQEDMGRVEQSLAANEKYFRSAKVQEQSLDEGVVAGDGANVCAGAVDPLTNKPRDLQTLQDCQKDCRTVCRWKQNVGSEHCYECPSGSPDSCWDVGAWPADHPWCKPGGVCHSDPMMVCAPFATTGPNLEKLNCTNCKQRPDMCWQKVPDNTMTWTNCKLGCWDGKCVYKGKYQEPEWDGTMENIHCFECKRPPPAPNCEDLKWGFDFKSDCENMCPAPGVCEEVSMPSGRPKAGQPGQEPGQQPGEGQQDGEKGQGEDTGATSAGGGQPPSTGGGKPANPPTGTPQQPGGGGSIAGGQAPGTSPAPTDAGKSGEPAQPPKDPGSTTVNPPPAPNTGGQPKPPSEPPKPPTNPDIEFYEKWRAETQERIKSREAILNDPNEGDYTREEAWRQLETMTREKKYLDDRIKEEQDKENERRRQAEEAKKRQEDWEKTRPKHVDYGEEMRTREREWKLNKLKEATDALTSKLKEAKEILTGRRERIEKLDKEIALLESEIKYMTEAAKEGRLDEDFAETQTRERQKRLKDLKDMRNQFIKKMNELQQQYQEELETLRTEYQRRLWSVDENARRKAETERMDEYFEKLSELRSREQALELRMQTFDSMINNLEGAARQAEADGDTDRAQELRTQAENIKHTKGEWKETLERQIDGIKEDLDDLNYRNGYEGVGPSSVESMAKKLEEYKGVFQGRINDAQKAIAELEGLSTRTPEQNAKLQALKTQVQGLNAAIEGLDAKSQDLAAGQPLPADVRQSIVDTTTRVAAGSMDQAADKSFLRLFGESLVEESIHNMNPLVAAKKSVAFGWGVAKGVGATVVGIVDLGVEAVDTLAEAAAVNAGFEDGGIFGTDNLDTINSAISGIGNNMNFDGAIKAVVAVGGMIDAEINRLAKSGDIDWATAELGGRVVGETVVGDMVLGAGLGKAGKALGWVDDAADVAKAGDKIMDAATVTAKMDDVSDAQRALSAADDLPTSTTLDGTSARAPPADGTPTVRDTFNPPPDDTPTQIGGFKPVDRGATTVRDPSLAGTLDDAPTVRDFNPPPDNSPTQIGGFNPGMADDAPTQIGGFKTGVADDAPTQVGGFRPDEDDLKTAVGGFKPLGVIDETPTQIGGLKPGMAEDGTVIGGLKPGMAEDGTVIGGLKPSTVEDAAKLGDSIPPPPPTIKPTPATVIGENKALSYVDANGQTVTLNTGTQLGKGSTSTVFADVANPKRAIRVTDIGGEVAQAPQLDKIGRETVQKVQDSLGKNSPIRIVEQDSITRVTDPNSPLYNKMVEIVEKMDQGSAKKVLEKQGGSMTSGQAKAFNDATKALNDKGYAWLDNHTGNYTFEPMPGGGPDDWRVVVIDPGGIAPMKGLSPDAARAVQGMINAPDAGFTDYWNKVKNSPGQFKDAVLGERWGEIIGQHGDNIDIGAMGLDSVEDLKFNPGGTLNHPQVQSLFGQ